MKTIRIGGFFSGIGAHHSAVNRIAASRPDLWKILENWEEKIPHHNKVKFKEPWTVADLAHRFERELKAEREQTKLTQWGLV